MLSFYQKLANKLNETGAGSPQDAAGNAPAPAGAAPRGVFFKATGERNGAADAPGAIPASAGAALASKEAPPDGTEPLDVDLFQSDARMVVFAQMPGVAKNDFEITVDQEANTVTIQAAQKRPSLPPMPGIKEGAEAEKGMYVKQETKWKNLYRKVYLPSPFDGGEAGAFLDRGVLVVILPLKRPGTGKKLAVKEIADEKHEEPSGK